MPKTTRCLLYHPRNINKVRKINPFKSIQFIFFFGVITIWVRKTLQTSQFCYILLWQNSLTLDIRCIYISTPTAFRKCFLRHTYIWQMCVIYFLTWTHTNKAQKFNSILNIWNNINNTIMVMWALLKEFRFLNLKCFWNLWLKCLFIWPDLVLWYLRKAELELMVCYLKPMQFLYQSKQKNACFIIYIYTHTHTHTHTHTQGHGCGSCSINIFQVVLVSFN